MEYNLKYFEIYLIMLLYERNEFKFYKWIYERSYIWTAEKDLETDDWSAITVKHPTIRSSDI